MGLESKEGGVETKAYVPKSENQWHRARALAVALKSQSDELFVREKEWRRLRAQTAGISTLCVWGWSTKLARVLIAHAEPLAIP